MSSRDSAERPDFYRFFYRNFYRTGRNRVEVINTDWHVDPRKTS